MANITLTCPIDGLQAVGTYENKPQVRTNMVQALRIGGHVHMEVKGELECPNGHRWKASGDYIIERVK